MRSAAVVVLLVLAGGCGRLGFEEPPPSDAPGPPVIPAPPSYVSGTRLRAHIVDVEGSTRRTAWFDTQLGEECLRMVAEDGVERCLPSRYGGGAQFSDATCATPLVVGLQPANAADCPSANKLAQLTVGGATHIVDVGAPYTGQAYQLQAGSCVMVGSSGFPLYVAGATVAPASFVAFHDELTPTGDLAYLEHVADDGARELDERTLVLRATGEKCKLTETAWDRVTCIADRPYAGFAYLDAACSEPIALVVDQVAPEMTMGRVDVCGDDYFHVTLADELTTYYQLGTQGCVPQTTSPGIRAFHLSAIVPEVGFARGTLVPNDAPAGASVVGAYWKLEAGQTLPAGYYDRTHGDRCNITTLAGGGRVCAPVWTGSGASLYSDAACTTAIAGYPTCRGSWRSMWFPALAWTCDGPGSTVKLYDQPIAAPTYRQTGTSCVVIDEAVVAPHSLNTQALAPTEMTPATSRTD